MLENIIFPGYRIDMELIRYNNTQDGINLNKVYHSMVHDIISEDRIEVTMPQEQGRLQLLPIDGEFDLYFYTAQGLYQCQCRVEDRYKNNNVFVLVMELTTGLRKHQRRDFYRLSCSIDAFIRYLNKDEVISAQGESLHIEANLALETTSIVDISGGGIRFISGKSFEQDRYIYIKFAISCKGKIKDCELVGSVICSEELPNRDEMYEHRVKFINIDRETREEIIQYIFDEERRRRSREK